LLAIVIVSHWIVVVIVLLWGHCVKQISELEEFIVEVIPLLWINKGEGGIGVIIDNQCMMTM